MEEGSSRAQPGAATQATTPIMMPASLRVTSRSLLSQTTSLWLTNMIFCWLLWHKLAGSSISWWLTFSPTLAGHVLYMCLEAKHLQQLNRALYFQLGPPPPARASMVIHVQYETLLSMRARSHVLDHATHMLESAALLAVKLQFAQLLQAGVARFQAASMCAVFTPIWVVWVIAAVLGCCKHPKERSLASQRDLLNVFLLLVALKVDSVIQLPWRTVFVPVWLWLGCCMLMALFMAGFLLATLLWSRARQLTLPTGLFLLTLTTGVPHAIFAHFLVRRLDSDASVSYTAILVPAIVGWGSMYLSALVLTTGLRRKERVREALLAAGSVWTAREVEGAQARELLADEQRRIDAMSVEQLVQAGRAHVQARGAVAPATLLRAGPTLYRRSHILQPACVPAAPAPDPDSCSVSRVASLQDMLHQAARSSTAPSDVCSACSLGEDLHAPLHQQGPLSSTGTSKPSLQLASMPSATAALPAGPASTGVHGAAQGAVTIEMPLLMPLAGPAHAADSQGTSTCHLAAPLLADSSACPGQVSTVQYSDQPATDWGAGGSNPRLVKLGFGLGLGLQELLSEGELQGADGAGGQGQQVQVAPDEAAEDGCCGICYEPGAQCIVLNCGHGVFCLRCAHLLLLRPPSLCAMCRQPVELIVELDMNSLNLGSDVVAVRPPALPGIDS